MLSQAKKAEILTLIASGMPKGEIARLAEVNPSSITKLLKTRKRVLIVSDSHCGGAYGLTPPDWQYKSSSFYGQQVELWGWFKRTVEMLKPDICIFAGDAIDGKGKRSGGIEQITTSFKKQLVMFRKVLETINAPKVTMVRGTPYHVGTEEAYEDFMGLMKTDFEVKIGGHEFPIVHGIQFDVKHKIGSSSVPYGSLTPLAKAKLWNRIWNDHEGQPKADVFIRGHAHKFDFCGNQEYLGITCPTLCGWGSKFGVEQCEKVVDTGMLWLDIYDGSTLDNLHLQRDLPKLRTQRVKTYEL